MPKKKLKIQPDKLEANFISIEEPVNWDDVQGLNKPDNNATDDTAADTAQAAADAAQVDATANIALLADIADDAKITPVEKLTIKPLWDAIVAEKSDIDTQADAYSVSKTAYGTAYNDLNTYLNTTIDVFANMATTSSITRATWDGYWEAYYNAKIEILDAITDATDGATTGDNLVDSGSNVLDDTHVKNIGTLTAGETINGATLPVAVYVSQADNEVYACDGNDTGKTKCIGFAISNGTDGNSINVQFIGIVPGFSGLTEGVAYYVQDDKTLGVEPGTYNIQVGIAVSATEMVIYLEDIGTLFEMVVSDNLKVYDDTEETETADAYVLKKQITINYDGVIRIKFDLHRNGGDTAYGRIYLDDVAEGTEQSCTSATYVTYSEDITVTAGQKVQIWTYSPSGADTTYLRNFRIYYDNIPIPPFTVDAV